MAVAADSATAPAPLLYSGIAVPSSPSEVKGEEGTSMRGGAVGGAEVFVGGKVLVRFLGHWGRTEKSGCWLGRSTLERPATLAPGAGDEGMHGADMLRTYFPCVGCCSNDCGGESEP